MSEASCCLVLHTHLPFVHHPRYDEFLEEDWLFEAITDTYLPLIAAFERLEGDGIPFRLAMSLTPPLLEMFATADLADKATRYMEKRRRLARSEIERYDEDDPRWEAARHYAARLEECLETWDRHERNPARALAGLADRGRVEIIASAATHGLLPLFATDESIEAQLRIGLETHEERLGRRPRGFWLPECAYRPGLDAFLSRAGIEWTVFDTHAVTSATPRPPHGTLRPIELPAGLAAFGRDAACSQQVWSSEAGYPGDPEYRELYKDLGFEADYRYIRPYLKPDGVRRNVGIKYHRVTGHDVPLHEKDFWRPSRAKERAATHARDFLDKRNAQFEAAGASCRHPVVTAPFDTELFGHWWYEGPWFLENVFRQAAARDDLGFAFRSPGDVLETASERPRADAHASSWGAGGFFRVWLNETNDWFWPYLHEMEARMARWATQEHPPERRRLLAQMGRELLLTQSSDWAFILTQRTSAHYAERRFRDHVHRFFALERALESGEVDEGELRLVEADDSAFPDLDPAAWAPSDGA